MILFILTQHEKIKNFFRVNLHFFILICILYHLCLERESNSFLKCFKFALLPISYPGFFWRKIDSNYHILYCKYNRLPIIIFPLINIKRIIFLTLFYIIPILVSTFYLSYALFSRFYPILPFPPIPPFPPRGSGYGRGSGAEGCGRRWLQGVGVAKGTAVPPPYPIPTHPPSLPCPSLFFVNRIS